MTSTLTEPKPSETRTAWLADHTIAGSLVITALTGVALQLTHMVDLEDRAASLVGWSLSVRFIDFGFRTLLGATVVLAVLPWLFGRMRYRPWFGEYLRHLRLVRGPAPRLTLSASAASVGIMAALVVGLAAAFGALRVGLDFVLDDSRWFVVILALVPAVWEELAFRGLMLNNLQRRFRPWVAILISSAFFGLFHVSGLLLRNPDQVVAEMVMAAAVAIGWGYAVVETGSVVPAILSHYAINVCIGLLLVPELSESAGAVIFGSLTVAYPILTVLGVRWIVRRHRSGSPAPELRPRRLA